jgi:hypothetical protein
LIVATGVQNSVAAASAATTSIPSIRVGQEICLVGFKKEIK